MFNKYKQRQRILTNADPGLLALAYAVSIAEERHPAGNEFEEKLVNHSINSKFSRSEVEKRETRN